MFVIVFSIKLLSKIYAESIRSVKKTLDFFILKSKVCKVKKRYISYLYTPNYKFNFNRYIRLVSINLKERSEKH